MNIHEVTEIIPSARRLMTSLRDIGYDLPIAVADLVDNSIDANARRVEIIYRHDEESWLRVADDGLGMSHRMLDEAMRYGTEREYRQNDLGHFGLGLKTASLSQCRCLTVASRTTPRGRIAIRRWDLDHVLRTNRWELHRLLPSTAPQEISEALRGQRGTVVLWQQLDRLLAYKLPGGERARVAVDQQVSALREHLAMVFHRFLSGEAYNGTTRLMITVNDTPVQAWDPYARDEPFTQVLPAQQLPVETDAGHTTLSVQPYVLPNQMQFSSVDAHNAAAGPLRWNRQQGVYIYRRDRLIQSGGWNRLRTMDEHSKLARIALDVPPELESAFQVDVAKMRVSLPEAVRPALRAVAAGVVARAQDAYRQRVRLVSSQPADDVEPDDLDVIANGDQPVRRLDADWRLITSVVGRELRAHPEMRDRILLQLANEPPDESASRPAIAEGPSG